LAILELIDIHTYYGDSYVLRGVSLEVGEGSVVALLGRNGMGKTTTIRSIMEFTPPRRGVIRFKGREITLLKPYSIVRMGVGLVPQGRQIWPSLTVEQTLTMSARSSKGPGAWNLQGVYSLFPILKRRAKLQSSSLSGGEQQMLSIGRALMTNPELLLMDEPSEGLAPILVLEVAKIIERLQSTGLSVLLVEQNLQMGLKVSEYVYVLSKGVIVCECTPEELAKNDEVKGRHLGVA
jgi:branched-chain amino acid transport system ATP-binding protein